MQLSNTVLSNVEFGAQRTLDGDFAVGKIGGTKELAVITGFKTIVRTDNIVDLHIAEVLTLTALRFTHWRPDVCQVNQLHLILTSWFFMVRQNPDVGANARVEEHIGWQGNNCFYQVLFQQPAADF